MYSAIVHTQAKVLWVSRLLKLCMELSGPADPLVSDWSPPEYIRQAAEEAMNKSAEAKYGLH